MTLVRFLLVRLAMGVLGLLVFASAIWLLSIWLIPGDFTSNFIGVNKKNETRSGRRWVWTVLSSSGISSSSVGCNASTSALPSVSPSPAQSSNPGNR